MQCVIENSHEKMVNDIAFIRSSLPSLESSNKLVLVSISNDKKVKIWDPQSSRNLKILDSQHQDSVTSLAAPNCQKGGFLTTDESGKTIYFNNKGEEKYSFAGCRSARTMVDPSFKLYTMMSANRKKLLFTNLEDTEEVSVLCENCEIVNYDIHWKSNQLLTIIHVHAPVSSSEISKTLICILGNPPLGFQVEKITWNIRRIRIEKVSAGCKILE